MKEEVWVVLCNFPNRETAREIATELVEKQLAACVNLLGSAESVYRWEGRTCREEEFPALIKTTASRYPELEAFLLESHPHEVPEILAFPAAAGLPAYLRWVEVGAGG